MIICIPSICRVSFLYFELVANSARWQSWIVGIIALFGAFAQSPMEARFKTKDSCHPEPVTKVSGLEKMVQFGRSWIVLEEVWNSLLFVTLSPVLEITIDSCAYSISSFQGVGYSFRQSFNHELINGFVHSFSCSYHVYLVRLFCNACFVYSIYLTIHLILFGSICFYLSFVKKIPLCRKAVQTDFSGHLFQRGETAATTDGVRARAFLPRETRCYVSFRTPELANIRSWT